MSMRETGASEALRRQQSGTSSGRPVAAPNVAAEDIAAIPNGPGAAAILAAGIGCFALGVFATLGDAFPAVARFFTFYLPTGPLSGVTTSAIIVWLAAWYALSLRWRRARVALGSINVLAFVLLALGVLLTFPPFSDLIQGK
jgi:hypothetical protein